MSIVKVLIVAKEPWITLDLKYRLQRLGYKTIVASESASLAELIHIEQPDIVLLEKQRVGSETIGTIEAANLPTVCFNAASQPFDIPIDLPCLSDPHQESLLETVIRTNLQHHQSQAKLAQQHSNRQSQIELLNKIEDELRNPLNALLMSLDWLERIEQEEQSDRSHQKLNHLASARNLIQQIVELLDRTLLISRSQTGKLAWEPIWIDLCEFCQELIAEIEQLYSTVNIDFVYLSANRMIQFDEITLRQILTHLLINALKYSHYKNPVNLSVVRNPNHVVFQIQDRGIGILESECSMIFNPLYRGSNAEEFPGAGMGLAIVHQLVSSAGGSITVESTPTIGSTFTVILPLAS